MIGLDEPTDPYRTYYNPLPAITEHTFVEMTFFLPEI